jgi:putative FmdB family regulatory protein
MPNYEFACGGCAHVFCVILKIDDRENTQKCPECGSENTNRNTGSFATPRFQGSHFKSQVESPKPTKKVHLGFKSRPKRWGFSKF